ncbi:4-coumarate-CoA ligase [Thozetella sp. PMI_491]|nr:4-coumarate-CoA ligase [Thozetella sp. PMI_491]
MAIWKSPHPDIDFPTQLTTWEWAFESRDYSSVAKQEAGSQGYVGAYENAVTKERLGFEQVKEKATLLSTVLVHRYNLLPGHTVSIFSGNTIWYPVALWATVRAGGRLNSASPSYNVDEMTHAMKTAQTKIVFTELFALPVTKAAAAAAGIPQTHIFLFDGRAEGCSSVQDVIAAAAGLTVPPHYRIPTGQTNADVCGYLNFSSGTTGLPKAVMLSHANVIAQCHQLRQLQVFCREAETADGRKAYLPVYRILAIMPLFHITGLVRFCHYPVFVNGLSVMLPKYTVPSMLQGLIDYRMEEVILVPAIFIRLVRDPVVKPYLPALRQVVKRWGSGSAPISPQVIRQLRELFPETGFRQGYGATESTACISAHPPSYFDYKYAATGGKLVANTTARVLSLDSGLEPRYLGVNETGEICARGPQIAMGYLGNPEATAETFDGEGYFHTGDVGYIDEDGLIHISDRIKEMIKVKGQQVAPAELEDLLLGHPGVEDAAVLGVLDELAGERPKAFVVPTPGTPYSSLAASSNENGPQSGHRELGLELLRYVKERKVRYKWLTEIEVVATIPRNPTGKLLRRVLKGLERETGRQKGVIVRDREGRGKL